MIREIRDDDHTWPDIRWLELPTDPHFDWAIESN